jgi:integrase
MVKSHRLSALEIAAKSEPGRYGDGHGLYLQISKWQTKSWIFRYERDGRERQMGLGPAGARQVSLSEARKLAARCVAALREGLDPIDERQGRVIARRVQAARSVTFKKCAEDYIAEKEAGWSNPKHRAQWSATLETYAYPVFGDLPVTAVDLPLIMKALKPIWTVKPETAGRVRGRIESVLSYATVHGFRQGDNPARWRGHLDQILPAKGKVSTVKHHKAMPFNQLAAFLKLLRPSDRMKAGKEHRVPLSDRAIEIIESVKHNQKFLFPGATVNHPLSNMAMLEMLRGMVGNGLTVHGFRSSFMDWGHEVTDYPKEMLDIALAHTVSDKVEAAYRRGDMFEKRRALMADWAAYCSSGGE